MSDGSISSAPSCRNSPQPAAPVGEKAGCLPTSSSHPLAQRAPPVNPSPAGPSRGHLLATSGACSMPGSAPRVRSAAKFVRWSWTMTIPTGIFAACSAGLVTSAWAPSSTAASSSSAPLSTSTPRQPIAPRSSPSRVPASTSTLLGPVRAATGPRTGDRALGHVQVSPAPPAPRSWPDHPHDAHRELVLALVRLIDLAGGVAGGENGLQVLKLQAHRGHALRHRALALLGGGELGL